VLCGRVSNGCHVTFDTNSDADDNLDDPEQASDPDHSDPRNHDQDDTSLVPEAVDTTDGERAEAFGDKTFDHGADSVTPDVDIREGAYTSDCVNPAAAADGAEHAEADMADPIRPSADVDSPDHDSEDHDSEDHDSEDHDSAEDREWDDRDWGLPPSAFRPDPHSTPADPEPPHAAPELVPPEHLPPQLLPPEVVGRTSKGTWKVAPCPGDGQPRPLPVTIGVVVSVQSLFGFTSTPGQLMDRSALVQADIIRDLAQQPGTLFYRLLTDEKGNLLDVTEMGRFPSRKLGMAVKFRGGVCQGPTCTVAADRADLDHLVPFPEGPTAGTNLGPECRTEHRAKTHAGHQSARAGEHTTTWTTPTGHVYVTDDQPLPVEEWPS
jgi:hypothetical protein